MYGVGVVAEIILKYVIHIHARTEVLHIKGHQTNQIEY